MTRSTNKPFPIAVPVALAADLTQYVPGSSYTKAFDWTSRLKLPANYKRVLDFLIRICGRAGQNSSTHQFIGGRLAISEKTVSRAVARLETRGFITVRRGYQQPNRYIIHPLILKVAWTERNRAAALAELCRLAKPDTVSSMIDRHEHEACGDLSSARACPPARTYKEETLSAAEVSVADGTTDERKVIVDEIIRIRTELHQTDPDRYPQILSLKAYGGKLGRKSEEELKTELETNRKVLENSKKPKSGRFFGSGAACSTPSREIMVEANERERGTFTGYGEPWFVAWMGLDEREQIMWREKTEARMWNDPKWKTWCREHKDRVDQELACRRKTRERFREEWESSQQAQQNMVQTDAAEATPCPGGIDQPEVAAMHGSQITPAVSDPGDDLPLTSPKPPQQHQLHQAEQTASPTPNGTVLRFRFPIRNADT